MTSNTTPKSPSPNLFPRRTSTAFNQAAAK
jgi:hypothetical protein